MPDVWIYRGDDGKIHGHGAKGEKQWRKLIEIMLRLSVGELMRITFYIGRNSKFHGRYFAMVRALFERQEQFADEHMLRIWLQIGAGYCDLLPGPAGRMVAVPKSIDYRTLDQPEFEAVVADVVAFMRSDHAGRFLWPHLTTTARIEMIESMLSDFGE